MPTKKSRKGLRIMGRSVPAVVLIAACAALLLGVATTGPSAVDLIDNSPASAAGELDWRPDAPTDVALGEIPDAYLEYYIRFGAQMGIDWRFLAAIGGQESDHGRDLAVDLVNRSGCVGPMQLGTGGDCGDFVGEFGRDGDGDGEIDPRNTADAIATAAYGAGIARNPSHYLALVRNGFGPAPSLEACPPVMWKPLICWPSSARKLLTTW